MTAKKFSKNFLARFEPKWAQNCPKIGDFAIFSALHRENFLIFCMKLQNDKCKDINAKKIFGKFFGHFRPKWAQNGPEIGVFAIFSALDR